MEENELFNAMLFYSLDTFPAILYHYTSSDALIAILQSGRIRATHNQYLNDATETKWIWQSVIPHLERRHDTATDPETRQRIAAILEIARDLKSPSDFIASFSELGDDLSQWRAYCSNGPGFCIGFDSAALRTGWVSNPSGGEPTYVGSRLTKVRYIDDEWEDLDSILEQVLKLADHWDGKQGFHGPISRKDFVITWFSVLSSCFKHSSFRPEQEWRLILSKPHKPMPGQRFRSGKSCIVPFIEVELNRNSHSAPAVPYIVREVIVGPCPDPKLSIDALNAFFISAGQAGVNVRPSSIPYRNW